MVDFSPWAASRAGLLMHDVPDEREEKSHKEGDGGDGWGEGYTELVV
jgi:hypothetical protein